MSWILVLQRDCMYSIYQITAHLVVPTYANTLTPSEMVELQDFWSPARRNKFIFEKNELVKSS